MEAVRLAGSIPEKHPELAAAYNMISQPSLNHAFQSLLAATILQLSCSEAVVQQIQNSTQEHALAAFASADLDGIHGIQDRIRNGSRALSRCSSQMPPPLLDSLGESVMQQFSAFCGLVDQSAPRMPSSLRAWIRSPRLGSPGYVLGNCWMFLSSLQSYLDYGRLWFQRGKSAEMTRQ